LAAEPEAAASPGWHKSSAEKNSPQSRRRAVERPEIDWDIK
jgi:hypothetical protein